MITFGRTAILPTFAPPTKTLQPVAPAVMPQRLPQSASVYNQPTRYVPPSDATIAPTPSIRRVQPSPTTPEKPQPNSALVFVNPAAYRQSDTTDEAGASAYTTDEASASYQSSYSEAQAYTPEVVGPSEQTPGEAANQEMTKEEKAAAQAPAPFKMPTWGWIAGGVVLVAGVAWIAAK
jgi:hypothetical protein